MASNQTFREVRIDLNGKEAYTDCVSDRCTLVYSGDEGLKLRNLRFENCTYGFEGAAGNTINFLAVLYGASKFGAARVEETFEHIRRGSQNLAPVTKDERQAPN